MRAPSIGIGIGVGLASRGGSSFVPPSISGNVLWLRADMGVTLNATRVSGWADQSGTGDANKNVAQATEGKQPLFNASDANFNGHPSFTYSNVRLDCLQSGTWATPMPNPATWFIVARQSTFALCFFTDGIVGTNRQSMYQHTPAGAETQITSGTALTAAGKLSDAGTFVLGGVFGASGKIYRNAKTAIASGTTGTQTLTGLTIGALYDAAQFAINGQIAEVIGYNRALTQAEVETVLTYLGTRYAIAIGA
jgi:hypothetical protein